ncbi:MAG TPA: hypothetical protein DCR04_09605 [Flavobacteriales bacterium]|nr:hypothetical protein [Flavobacteriales bacterium]
MLRTITAFILIGLLFSNVFLKSAILLDFAVNQDFISKTLCIKKDVAENTCNGKCHLSKQLEKSEEQSEDTPVLPQNLKEVILFYKKSASFSWNWLKPSVINVPCFSALHGVDVSFSIFHPPQTVLVKELTTAGRILT